MDKKATPATTIRLTEQDKAAIVAIREQYGLASDSEAIRFALHTMWREISKGKEDSSSPAPNKERLFPPHA
jgi:Arc/MetJ-type ribon-helix-helix transcriptional regulator